jgi:hypothetical protein
MYSKTRNTLTALIAASLFIAAGSMFGHPLKPIALPVAAATMHASIIDSVPQVALASNILHLRHANRMNFAMPYYSFALQVSQRRTD